MSDMLSVPPAVVAGKGRIVADDILFMRKHLFPFGLTSAADAASLVAIHRSCPEKCPEWNDWFVEMLTAYTVFHSWPQHTLDDINAEWLASIVADDDIVYSAAELQLLLHVIEVSRHVPEQLSALAIRQLLAAVRTGTGALAEARLGKRRGIGPEDIAYLYRVLKGSAHDGKMFLGSSEIEALFALDSAVRGCRNHPAWYELVAAITERSPGKRALTGPWLRMLESDVYAWDGAAA